MSKLKPIEVRSQKKWAWDDSFSVAMAYLVEVADADIETEIVDRWRRAAAPPARST